MGRRSAEVAFYPGDWEFVPGGSVPADADPADVLLSELREESMGASGPARAVAMIYDPAALSWEIVSTLSEADRRCGDLPWEYDEDHVGARPSRTHCPRGSFHDSHSRWI